MIFFVEMYSLDEEALISGDLSAPFGSCVAGLPLLWRRGGCGPVVASPPRTMSKERDLRRDSEDGIQDLGAPERACVLL